MEDRSLAMANGGKRKPWDARLAAWCVRPLVHTGVTPNHLTTLRLLVGLVGIALIASDGYLHINVGMGCVVIANFLDHTDGELARMSGRISRWGHLYDLAVDALVTVLLFVAIGVALVDDGLGSWAVVLGIIAGVSVAAIFAMRMQIEDEHGKSATRQPHWAGFEAEDVLYLLPLVSLTDRLQPFLLAAALGASLFALWVLRNYLRGFGSRAADVGGPLR